MPIMHPLHLLYVLFSLASFLAQVEAAVVPPSPTPPTSLTEKVTISQTEIPVGNVTEGVIEIEFEISLYRICIFGIAIVGECTKNEDTPTSQPWWPIHFNHSSWSEGTDWHSKHREPKLPSQSFKHHPSDPEHHPNHTKSSSVSHSYSIDSSGIYSSITHSHSKSHSYPSSASDSVSYSSIVSQSNIPTSPWYSSSSPSSISSSSQPYSDHSKSHSSNGHSSIGSKSSNSYSSIVSTSSVSGSYSSSSLAPSTSSTSASSTSSSTVSSSSASSSSYSSSPSSSSSYSSSSASLSSYSSSSYSSSSYSSASASSSSYSSSSASLSSSSSYSSSNSASSTSSTSVSSTSSSTSTSSSASSSSTSLSSASSSSASSSSTSSTFSYPQPPIPTKTATTYPSAFTLSPDFEITSEPQTRYYEFDIDTAAAAPDGFLREIFAINNQYPGPVIEANSGDTIVVTVNNKLDAGQSIHWHGLHQNGTGFMDGVAGISQCSIPASDGSFTYNFTIDDQYGSYWYHSHYANTLADGIIGAFVIHSPEDPWKRSVDFDDERLLYLSDWMNDQSTVIVDALLSGNGYKGNPFPPQPDSVLINGVGQTNCSTVQGGTTCDSNVTPAEVHVVPDTRVRFRVMNTGAHALLRLSIDNHTLSVIEVDDMPITPVSIHELPVNPGQRYSIIVDMDQGVAGDAFWIRASVGAGCIAGGVEQVGTAVLRYANSLNGPFTTDLPTTSPWDDLADPLSLCIDLDETVTLLPLTAEAVSETTYQTAVMNAAAGNFVNASGFPYAGFGFNGVAFQNQINNPLLLQIEEGLTLDPNYVASATFETLGTVDIILNQIDGFIAHPFHLHGRPFYIVARGSGAITADDLPSLTINTANPIRRDTIQIPNSSYAVLRLITDTPGVWPLHCHIGWHLSEGKLAAMVVRPDDIVNFTKPAAWSNLCAGTNPDDFGPARRSRLSNYKGNRHSRRRSRSYSALVPEI